MVMASMSRIHPIVGQWYGCEVKAALYSSSFKKPSTSSSTRKRRSLATTSRSDSTWVSPSVRCAMRSAASPPAPNGCCETSCIIAPCPSWLIHEAEGGPRVQDEQCVVARGRGQCVAQVLLRAGVEAVGGVDAGGLGGGVVARAHVPEKI